MCYVVFLVVKTPCPPYQNLVPKVTTMLDDNGIIPPDASPHFDGINVERPGYSLYLQIPDNYPECRCSYLPHKQGDMLTRSELDEILNQHGVLEGIDRQAFEEFLVNAAAGRQQVHVLLASGTPPVDGSDGYFALSETPSTEILSGEDDETNVDMYIVQKFVNVSIGEEIGRIMPATPGVAGRNISGLPIPPQPGRPLVFKLGKNIHAEEEGTLLIADSTGRFCQLAGEFSVEEEYIVKGDVNFRTGIINFKGFVEVRGDVLDNFNITATKGVTVAGNIGACNIVSDGDITFCGMNGENRGSVVCGGTLHAHYIHDTVIECSGDVIVDVEIHNCTIRTLGRIVVNRDTISGGSCIALGGIEANKLGSPSSKYTSLLVGVDYRYVEELKRLLADLAETQSMIREARSLEEMTELRKSAARLSERIAIIRGKTVAAANAKINVKARLHENVRMAVGDVPQTVWEMKDGPLTIIENIVEGGLRFIPMTSLDIKATDSEKAFARGQKMGLQKSGR
ncbi:MAG: FapA family protein [Desulfuromonadales bacterium]